MRISVPLDGDDEERFRLVAAEQKLSFAALGRLAIAEWMADRDARRKPVAQPGEDAEAVRKRQFLAGIEEFWTIARTCDKLNVGRDEIRRWIRNDAAFRERLSEARAVFVETVEWRMVRLGMRKKNAQILALQTFLNAQHPQYGRLKYEAVIRWFGPFVEQTYRTIRTELGEKAGENLCAKIRELSEKALSKLSG